MNTTKKNAAKSTLSFLHCLLFSWLLLSSVFLLVENETAGSLAFGKHIQLPLYLSLLIGLTVLFMLLLHYRPRLNQTIKRSLLFVLTLFLTILTVMAPTWPLLCGVLLTLVAATFWYSRQSDVNKAAWPYVVPIIGALVLLVMAFTVDWEGVWHASVSMPRSLIWTPLLSGLAVLVGCTSSIIKTKVKQETDLTQRGVCAGFWPTAIVAVFILHLVALSMLMVSRVYSLYTPTYDFGIFAQMFDGMVRTGLPITTLERSRELSHFAVHASPIYYIWLPFYALLPSPETLQVLQIVTVASGLIPLYLIGKKMQVDRTILGVLSIAYLLHPGIIGSSMYDVHENAFLAPLLLWLLYAAQAKKTPLYFLFVLLTLAVKEDAVLYVIAVGAYLLWSKAMRVPAAISMVVSLVWFLLVARFLTGVGEGVMAYRFHNLMTYEEWGLAGVVFTVMVNPAYVFREMFSVEKVHYLQKILLPLGFIPLLQTRLRNMVLLVPLIVMNLVSRYPYQADIGFQYHYGTSALLFYLVLLFFSNASPSLNRTHDQRNRTKHSRILAHFSPRRAVLTAILSASLLFGPMLYANYSWPLAYAREKRTTLEAMKTVMDTIPDDASVRATTFLTTYLSARPFIVDLAYETIDDADQRLADYLVFDRRRTLTDKLQKRFDQAVAGQYCVYAEVENGLVVLKRMPDKTD